MRTPRAPILCASALAGAGAALSGSGCLAHARPVDLTDTTFLPEAEHRAGPVEIREGDVELDLQGDPIDARTADAMRAHIAHTLTRYLGPSAEGAARAHTRVALSSPRAPFLVTGPYLTLSINVETELPGGHVVHSTPRTVALDDDELFALEQWGYVAAAGQGAIALGLAAAGVGFAGNDPNQAAYTLAFSALPTASSAALTAVVASSLRGHAVAHERQRASDALLEALQAHASDLRADAARRSNDGHADVPADTAPSGRAASAVTLELHDDAACVSKVDLERDLEALVPASSSARFGLVATISAQARDELLVQLRLTDPSTAAVLADRELTVARGDCATLPRVIARIARTHIEAAAGSVR